MSDLRQKLDAEIEARREPLMDLSRKIHDEPELAFAEHKASRWICDLVGDSGAKAERPFGGLDTAFRARMERGTGPHIAILAEYDALPGLGHACGHNLIAGAAVGAWLALYALRDELPEGRVDLIGTPAEEGGGGKIRLIEAGAFEGVDAGMMFHPFDRDLMMHAALATQWLGMTFRGKPSHAAIAPEKGVSALTACMDTFRLVDGQRVHFPDGVRVHGFISDGGEAVNVIPELAKCEFSVRAPERALLEKIGQVVERCARGAAMASGVELDIETRQGYLNMQNNQPMARRLGVHLAELGRQPQERDPSVGAGSTDMGDVSHVVPAIHPWLAICDPGESICHQPSFADCANSQRGFDTMLDAAKAMARTSADLLSDAALMSEVKVFFEAQD